MNKDYQKKHTMRGLTVCMELVSHYQKNQDVIRQQRKRNLLNKNLKQPNGCVLNGQISPKVGNTI